MSSCPWYTAWFLVPGSNKARTSLVPRLFFLQRAVSLELFRSCKFCVTPHNTSPISKPHGTKLNRQLSRLFFAHYFSPPRAKNSLGMRLCQNQASIHAWKTSTHQIVLRLNLQHLRFNLYTTLQYCKCKPKSI